MKNEMFVKMLMKEFEEGSNPDIRKMIRDLNWPENSNQIGYCVQAVYQCILEDGLEVESITTDGVAYKITFRDPDHSQRIWFGDPDSPLSVLLVPKNW